MFSRIIAVIMSVISVFSAPFSQVFSKAELKIELAKGNYESPYIVRPLDSISVNGVSVDEYCIFAPDSEFFSDVSQTLYDEIYKACGKNKAGESLP